MLLSLYKFSSFISLLLFCAIYVMYTVLVFAKLETLLVVFHLTTRLLKWAFLFPMLMMLM
jgi:hypothetical protein